MIHKVLKYARLSLILQSTLVVSITFGSFGLTLLQAAMAANLKNMSIVEGNVIHASDLFEGLNRKADTVIGPAPLPGHDMTLNARTLLRIAVALDLPWRPETGNETILVRRAATIIHPDMITTTLEDALAQKGLTGQYRLQFDQGIPFISLPPAEQATLEIGSLNFDPVHHTFSAELLAPSVENPVSRQLVHGKVERIITLPVLKSPLQNGQTVTESDLNWIELPAYKIQPDYLLDIRQLEGMTPRRMVMAGEPLRRSDFIEPILIKRGENVLITYRTGIIQLSAEGKALQSGVRGEAIRVMNLSSNQIINALVDGTGQVSVN